MSQNRSLNQVLPSSEAEKTKIALISNPNLFSIEITCSICMDHYFKNYMEQFLPCQHTFCLSCLRAYVNEKIQNLQVHNIPCPQFGCRKLFHNEAIKSILDQETYAKYQEVIKLKANPNQNLNRIICPKSGCARTIIPKAQSGISACSCGTKICNICYHIDHGVKSCLEAIDSKFEIYSQENNIRFCAVCKTLFRREEGCLHVTCPICDYEWCWKCGRQYNKMHMCDGNWDPIPPAELRDSRLSFVNIKNTWMRGSVIEKVSLSFLLLLLSPVLLAACILFWPLYFIDLARDRPIRSFCLTFGSILSGIICLPITVFCISALLVGALLALPFVVIVLLVDFIRGKPMYVQRTEIGKRWLSGDSHQFIYIEAPKPINSDRGASQDSLDNSRKEKKITKSAQLKGKNLGYNNLKEDQENPLHVIIKV